MTEDSVADGSFANLAAGIVVVVVAAAADAVVVEPMMGTVVVVVLIWAGVVLPNYYYSVQEEEQGQMKTLKSFPAGRSKEYIYNCQLNSIIMLKQLALL